MATLRFSTIPLSQPAVQRVFNTPELLEIIHLSLPIQDLLVRAPLVNRASRNTIASSLSIQQKLFFRPDPFFRPSDDNPLLSFCYDNWKKWEGPNTLAHCDTIVARKEEAFRREEASWRKMLLVQPPAKEAFISQTRATFRDGQGVRLGSFGTRKRKAHVSNTTFLESLAVAGYNYSFCLDMDAECGSL